MSFSIWQVLPISVIFQHLILNLIVALTPRSIHLFADNTTARTYCRHFRSTKQVNFSDINVCIIIAWFSAFLLPVMLLLRYQIDLGLHQNIVTTYYSQFWPSCFWEQKTKNFTIPNRLNWNNHKKLRARRQKGLRDGILHDGWQDRRSG